MDEGGFSRRVGVLGTHFVPGTIMGMWGGGVI